MSTSVTKNSTRKYLYLSVLVYAIALIYEQFSNGVTSTSMQFAFLFPFLGGWALSLLCPRFIQPNEFSTSLWKMGISTLTVGYFLIGVFEIYGSMDVIVYTYLYIGWALLFISVLLYLFNKLYKESGD